ncbi:MAG: hypothetical protein L3K15_08510 [Thermoplasmata archaeon]|nr:hypothetical protein [Thermoplasmata archaeon]
MADSQLETTAPSTTARYVYLMTRLRTKQITMEEATELFSAQQAMIQAARATATRPGSPAGASGSPRDLAQGSTPGPLAITDDTLWTGLLFLGAGAGVLAAILRRAQAGPTDPKPAA